MMVMKTILTPDAFRDFLNASQQLPSASTVSTYGFFIDMAYSQYWRKDVWPNLLEDVASNKAALNFPGTPHHSSADIGF